MLYRSRDSVVGIAIGYRLRDRAIRVRVAVGSRIFTLHIVQTGSEVHPISYTVGTGGFFPEVKPPRREADLSSPNIAEVKKMWIYTSTPQYFFMA
jgi:hypothetical protein